MFVDVCADGCDDEEDYYYDEDEKVDMQNLNREVQSSFSNVKTNLSNGAMMRRRCPLDS